MLIMILLIRMLLEPSIIPLSEPSSKDDATTAEEALTINFYTSGFL